VATRVVAAANRGEVYEEVASRAARGERAFVVVPAIDDGEPAPATGREPPRGVESVLRELRGRWLRGLRVAGLHARMPGPTRAAVLADFRAGRLDVLVATTIVEVGVDVPEATMMVVEQADRFGLAQLHQLRGRVGRGRTPGVCVLVADAAGGTTPEAFERLEIMTRTADGFEIAEKDLEMRGPGELLGSKQAGLPPFRVADLMRDRELLGLASRDASAWIERSPVLGRPEEALLRRRLMKAYGPALGLADVG
jgi:ATP-dependent DNA helicase RecG